MNQDFNKLATSVNDAEASVQQAKQAVEYSNNNAIGVGDPAGWPCHIIKTWGATGLAYLYNVYIKHVGEEERFARCVSTSGRLWAHTETPLNSISDFIMEGDKFEVGAGMEGNITWSVTTFIYKPGAGWLCVDVSGGLCGTNFHVSAAYS